MKEYIRQLLVSEQDPLRKRHIVREYLQARILSSLQRSGAMVPLAFHGGTALRFLFQLSRYSEDLDFCLESNASLFDFRAYLRAIQSLFKAENYAVNIRANDSQVVRNARVRFQGLLYELDLSVHQEEVLSIRIEIDTNPPAGAGLETTIIRRHELLHLQHHDKASLFAGKIHAILQRPYTKGRDLYDLLWYLSSPEWPPPNLTMLNNALEQTGWSGTPLTSGNWSRILRRRLNDLDWKKALHDVRPFLMDSAAAELLTQENLFWLLDRQAGLDTN